MLIGIYLLNFTWYTIKFHNCNPTNKQDNFVDILWIKFFSFFHRMRGFGMSKFIGAHLKTPVNDDKENKDDNEEDEEEEESDDE